MNKPAEETTSTDRKLSDVRELALQVLLRLESSKTYVDEELASRVGQLPIRDRALAQEITYGTLRHQSTLDLILDHYLKLPTARQNNEIKWALRLGAYQIVYLGRIPAHAALNQTLEGLKRISGVNRKTVGFANAILRRVVNEVRKKTENPSEDPDDPSVLPIRTGFCHLNRPLLPLFRMEPEHHLALKYSHPISLVKRWVKRFGDGETRQILEKNNARPDVTARLTSRAPSMEEAVAGFKESGFETEALSDAFLRIGPGGDLGEARPVKEGWVQIQDSTAAAIGAVLSPPANARVLDLCAAPGGKSTQLLESLEEGGELFAGDRTEEKLQKTRENLERVGSGKFSLVLLPDNPDEIKLEGTFTHILVDAPCSNTGVLARRPEARWRFGSQSLNGLQELQGKLLEAAYRHLAPGGRLVYSTCSIEPEENEEQIAALLKKHDDLVELDVKLFLPHRVVGDGGFYSLVRRATG